MPENIDRAQRTRRRSAVRGAALFAAGQGAAAALLLWIRWQSAPPCWASVLLLVLALADLAAIPFIFVVLKQRLKEIKGGEIDAAAQY